MDQIDLSTLQCKVDTISRVRVRTIDFQEFHMIAVFKIQQNNWKTTAPYKIPVVHACTCVIIAHYCVLGARHFLIRLLPSSGRRGAPECAPTNGPYYIRIVCFNNVAPELQVIYSRNDISSASVDKLCEPSKLSDVLEIQVRVKNVKWWTYSICICMPARRWGGGDN